MINKSAYQPIEVCIHIASKHFKVKPKNVLMNLEKENPSVNAARCMVWHHLKQELISKEDIAKLLKTTVQIGHLAYENWSYSITDEDHLTLARMVKVENETLIVFEKDQIFDDCCVIEGTRLQQTAKRVGIKNQLVLNNMAGGISRSTIKGIMILNKDRHRFEEALNKRERLAARKKERLIERFGN